MAIQRQKSLQIILPISVIVLTIIIVTYLLLTKPGAEVKPIEKKRWLVDTILLEPDTYIPKVKLYGNVESNMVTNIEATINADVIQVNADEGEIVKKNELLIILDDREINFIFKQREADVKELETKIKSEHLKYDADILSLKHESDLIELAKKDINRMQHLTKTRAASQSQLDDMQEEYSRRMLQYTTRELQVADFDNRLATLQANLQKAEAILNDVKLDIERTKIKAPYSGRINQVMVEVGDRVQPGEQMLQMFNDNDLKIHAQIPINYLKKINQAIQEGLKLDAWIEVDSGKVAIVLDRLGGQIKSGRAGIDGIFHLKNSEDAQRLTVGRTVPIYIGLQAQQNVYALPVTAIYGSDKIFKVKNGKLNAIKIIRVGSTNRSTGRQDGKNSQDNVIVRSDKLQPGDEIVISQLPNAVSGLEVKTTSIEQNSEMIEENDVIQK